MSLSPVISRYIIPVVLKLLYARLRISVTQPLHQNQLRDKKTIILFWHGKMVVGWLFAKILFSPQKTTAVVSLSQDGRTLADTLDRLGFALIRGSSSRGGEEVRRSIQEALDHDSIVVMTPDGPRGPINQFKYGLLRLASKNRYSLVFAEITYTKKWMLKSWDQFEIPKPFSKTFIRLHVLELPDFKSEKELHHYSQILSERFTHA